MVLISGIAYPKEVPASAQHLVALGYKNVPTTSLAMCPRLAFFVAEATREGVGLEAMRLACIMERGAGTFNPQEVYLVQDGAHSRCPLLTMSEILSDVPAFVRLAQSFANERDKCLMHLKIFPRRLLKASDLWWKSDPDHELQPSELSDEIQSKILESDLPSLTVCVDSQITHALIA